MAVGIEISVSENATHAQKMSSLPRPWIETPLIESSGLSQAAGCRIFLKLENLQPSGSFKQRGIGNLILSHVVSHPPGTKLHFYSSSGGNAGMACVTAARSLGYPATVVVPLSTTKEMMQRIQEAGADDVIQHGSTWREADEHLRQVVMGGAGTATSSAEDLAETLSETVEVVKVYVPPFDDPAIWAGNATMVTELRAQMEQVDARDRQRRTLDALYHGGASTVAPGAENPQPGHVDGVVCCVGGGGLFAGVMDGLEAHYPAAAQPLVLAVETAGAHSLAAALEAGRPVTLDGISSIATSLGARQVADRAFELASERANVRSAVVPDWQAARGCVRLSEEERLVVEAACGASVGVCWGGRLRAELERWKAARGEALTGQERVVVVVCGGTNVDASMLHKYERMWREGEEKERKLSSLA